MSRRQSARGRGANPPARGPERGGRAVGAAPAAGVPRIVAVLVIIGAIAAAVWLVRSHRPAPTGGHAAENRVLADSLQAADARQDWVAALRIAEDLGRRLPFDSSVLLARGTVWSNYAVAQRPGRTIARPALRTSLERIACLGRALVLTDSAGMTAGTLSRWVKATKRLAELDETIGLPGDALLAEESIKQRAPAEMEAAFRAYWLRAVFYDPVHPDTSQWDRRMRALGRR